jgi:serine/threonine protein kinase
MAQDHKIALPNGYEFDGYRIDSVLGAGGFGITYRALELSIGRQVAIKEFLPSGIATRHSDHMSVQPISSSDAEDFDWGLDRFRKEAQTLVSFRHPNIVAVLRFFNANGTAYMVMQYEEGESLGGILRRAKTLEQSELEEILVPLLDGLEEVHRAGFLHRDIKPDNIYIRLDGSPVLLDFGAARQAVGRKSQSVTAIVSGGYSPFEQYSEESNQGPWTDIYAMGAVMYHGISGKKPPDSLTRVREDAMASAAAVGRGKYDPAFLKAIDKALAVYEEDRPQDIAEWRTHLGIPEPERKKSRARLDKSTRPLHDDDTNKTGRTQGRRGGAGPGWIKWAAGGGVTLVVAIGAVVYFAVGTDSPGVYASVDGYAGQAIAAGMVREVGGAPNGDYPTVYDRDLRGGCFARPVSRGTRLTWEDIGLCRS